MVGAGGASLIATQLEAARRFWLVPHIDLRESLAESGFDVYRADPRHLDIDASGRVRAWRSVNGRATLVASDPMRAPLFDSAAGAVGANDSMSVRAFAIARRRVPTSELVEQALNRAAAPAIN